MSRANIIPMKTLETAVIPSLDRVSRRAMQDRALFLMSFKAGLRAAELAGLKWRDVCDVYGQIVASGDLWYVPDNICKYGGGRWIPMHPTLRLALEEHRAKLPEAQRRASQPVFPPAKPTRIGDHAKPNTMQRYIGRRYEQLGLSGCSSHSGRRSFVTALARSHNEFGCSLRDVQKLAGHKNLATTETYIELSDGVSALVKHL
jgi:integrase